MFSGQRYCLGVGWTRRTEAEVRERVAVAATAVARGRPSVETTGDLDLLATLRSAAARSEADRVAAEEAELTDAAASVAKVWLLRHEVQGVPLPAGFLDDHPEAIAARRRPRRRPSRGRRGGSTRARPRS